MLFSVIIPVGNKAPHLDRSINSVLNQTFTDFELILVNDATTDGSSQKLLEFNDARIKILHRDVPGPGGYAARNLGIKEARSKWIAFLDADDEWHPEYLDKMAEAIRTNVDINVFSSAYYYSDGNSKTFNRYHKYNSDKGDHKFDFSGFLLYKPIWTGTVVINRDSIIQAGGFPEGRANLGGDEYLWLNIMDKERKGYWLNFAGATYYRNSVNMVTRTNTADMQSMILYPALLSIIAKEKDAEVKTCLKKYWNYKAWYFFKDIARRRPINADDLKYYFWSPATMNIKILLAIAYSFKNLFASKK